MRNKSIVKSLLLCGVAISLAGLSVTLAADEPETVIPIDPVAETVAELMADVSMAFTADHKLQLAGVVSVHVDDGGVTTVELKRNGDFDLDPVLTLTVPLVEDSSGQIVAAGIQEIRFAHESVVVTIQQESTGHRDAGDADECEVVMPLSRGEPRCAQVTCPAPNDECKWIIKEPDEDTGDGTARPQHSGMPPSAPTGSPDVGVAGDPVDRVQAQAEQVLACDCQ